MPDFVVTNEYLEYPHVPTSSRIPVVAPIEISTGYLAKLVSSQELIIQNILTELQALKVQEASTQEVEMIAAQEQLLNDIVSELQGVQAEIQNISISGGNANMSILEGLVGNILNVELPSIRNYLASVNNKLPSGDFPVALTLTQKELLDNIIILLTTLNADINAIGVNSDDIYAKLQEILDQYPDVGNGDDSLATYLSNLITSLDSLNTLFAGASGTVQQTTHLSEIKSLLPGADGVADNLATHLGEIKTAIEAVRDDLLTPQEVLLATAQEAVLSSIPTKLDTIIANTADDGGGGTTTVDLSTIEGYLQELRAESNVFTELPMEIIPRQEQIINDIYAQVDQMKRYLARLVDPLGEDIDGSQIVVSQQIFDKLEALSNFIQGRYAENPPVIKNIHLPLANSEYYFDFPVGTKRYAVKARGGPSDPATPTLRFAFQAAIVGTPTTLPGDNGYDTISYDAEESDQNIYLTAPLRMYLATDTPDTYVVIKYWS